MTYRILGTGAVMVCAMFALALTATDASAQECWDCHFLDVECIGCGEEGGIGFQCFDECEEKHTPTQESCTISGNPCGAFAFIHDLRPDGSYQVSPTMVSALAVLRRTASDADWGPIVEVAGRISLRCNGAILARQYDAERRDALRRTTMSIAL